MINRFRNRSNVVQLSPVGVLKNTKKAFALLPVLAVLCAAPLAHAYQNSWQASDPLPARGSIAALHQIRVVASTVDPTNHDQNPYGLVIVQPGAALTGKLKVGDLLVSNINNASNVMGTGTTIELIRPSDMTPAPTTFFSGAASPIAMVLNANATSVWIANYGLDPTGVKGNVDVVNNQGVLFPHGDIVNKELWGSWGQGFNGQPVGGTVPPVFFDTNVLTGAVYRLQHFATTAEGPNFAGATITQIAALGHMGGNINDVVGPQGMVWSKWNDTLYVADPVANSIIAIPNSTTTSNVGVGNLVYTGGPLRQPAGLALNPLNGDLLTVNQGDNKLIEINPTTHQIVAIRLLDKTPPINGAGSALFGLAATTDANGNLLVYFTDDNTNTVNVLY